MKMQWLLGKRANMGTLLATCYLQTALDASSDNAKLHLPFWGGALGKGERINLLLVTGCVTTSVKPNKVCGIDWIDQLCAGGLEERGIMEGRIDDACYWMQHFWDPMGIIISKKKNLTVTKAYYKQFDIPAPDKPTARQILILK
jgi:hypothetical protein